MRIAVIIASTGRPKEVAQWKNNLNRQSYLPTHVFYSVASQYDIPTTDQLYHSSTVIIGGRGLSGQRNRALEKALQVSDVIAFFDDDYVPDDYCLEGIAALMETHPNVVGASGLLLKDGIKSAGISYTEALKIIAARGSDSRKPKIETRKQNGLYGCNMVYRSSSIGTIRFDEMLPLYAWQEDVDFALQMKQCGEICRTNAFVGVHQGVKSGRTSGVKLGYSQVANPIYLMRKGTVPIGQGCQIIAKNVIANFMGIFWPEPWVDRWGRLRGNCAAAKDLINSKLHPSRILDMK